MTPEEELLDTIEQIRKQRFPELDADLVQHIVAIERDYTENRPEAYRRIALTIDAWVEKRAARKARGA